MTPTASHRRTVAQSFTDAGMRPVNLLLSVLAVACLVAAVAGSVFN